MRRGWLPVTGRRAPKGQCLVALVGEGQIGLSAADPRRAFSGPEAA